jgi:hypothetical protein
MILRWSSAKVIEMVPVCGIHVGGQWSYKYTLKMKSLKIVSETTMPRGEIFGMHVASPCGPLQNYINHAPWGLNGPSFVFT